jgi:uncharacterized protein (TIGR04255 family)
MAHSRPKFEFPPVVETVLGVQFANLPGYTTAHAGWFWKEYLEKLNEPENHKWSTAVDAPRLEDQFERFGGDDSWGPMFALKALPSSQSHRTQIFRSDNERLIQVQDSRLLLNWKKQSGAYPSFGPLLEEFRTVLHAFETFAHDAHFGAVSFNQWETVYVDQLKKGEFWESPRDWSRIFPGLSLPQVKDNPLLASGDEVVSADWRFSISDRRGRMYISLRQAKVPPSNEEVLNITFLARGPLTATEGWERGLELGHEVLNDTFLAITSLEAQSRWKKRA